MKRVVFLLMILVAGTSQAAPKKPRAVAKTKKAVPAPVAAPVEPETVVLPETTSFEAMVAKSQQAARDPASIKPSARVISVRRELGLTRASADQAPLDIVLNAGASAGLSEGMTLALMRKVPVLDPYRDNQQRELEVEYGTVKIIHVQSDIAVARLEKIEPIKSGLAMGTRAVFVGDYVGRAE